MVSTHRDPVVVDLVLGGSPANGSTLRPDLDGLVRRALAERPLALEFELDADPAADAASAYELTVGHVQKSYPELFRNADQLRVGLTQEFGTLPSALVLAALVAENAAWHHGTREQRERAGERLLRAFQPDSQTYAERVVLRGLSLFFRTVDKL